MMTDRERAEVRGWFESRKTAFRNDDRPGAPPVDLFARAAIEDPSAYVRWNALSVLDHHGDFRHAEVFLCACADPVPRVRRHALHALSCERCKSSPLGVDVVPTLAELALNDSSPQVRAAAVQALRIRDDTRARDALDAVLRTESNANVRGWVTWRQSDVRAESPPSSNRILISGSVLHV
jgi:HEAT repeat protein